MLRFLAAFRPFAIIFLLLVSCTLGCSETLPEDRSGESGDESGDESGEDSGDESEDEADSPPHPEPPPEPVETGEEPDAPLPPPDLGLPPEPESLPTPPPPEPATEPVSPPEPEPEPPPPPPDPEEWGATYYIRPAGGTAAQCTGLADADYPGSGTNQPCAWSHPFIPLPPEGSPRILGGDRLVIAAGSYRMGLGAPGADACSAAFPWDCIMARPPSGPDADHPTRIYGAGWENGCTDPPELYGAERPWQILDLSARSNLEIKCLEITDHSPCIEFHANPTHRCRRDSYPYGDWASVGIYATDSSNVTLRGVGLHGLAHTGIQAGRISNWLLENVRIAHNGWVGWDGDVDGDDSNSGTITFRRVVIEWNGCGETWPGGQTVACWGQSAGGYGDGLGTGTTGGDWIFEDSSFLHNTSDGLDLLYHNGNGSITIERVRAEGNAGNQLKTSGDTLIRNSVIVGNCGYFDGEPFTDDVDHCRALGNAVSLNLFNGTEVDLVNSSIYSEGDCALLVTSTSGECSGASVASLNNIFLGDVDYHQPFERSCFYYQECDAAELDQDFCVIYGVKNNPCPVGPNDRCQDPLLGPLTGEAYGMVPSPGSPAIDSGLPVGGLIPEIDFLGNGRPSGDSVDRGAYEIGPSW